MDTEFLWDDLFYSPLAAGAVLTFPQNGQDLWFDQMGDGKRVGANPPFNWVAPDGCLCDVARPGWIVYKQGDGRTAIHDWAMEFTAAGVVLQAELLLISQDAKAIAHYLPMLERSANFIETRRDPANNLFLAGPAGNLLAPSYAGWKRPDGTYYKAYLAGLSVSCFDLCWTKPVTKRAISKSVPMRGRPYPCRSRSRI